MDHQVRKAFTLVEMITVTAVLVILIAILLPSLRMVRELANRIQCSANLKTWGAACLGFAVNHKGHFPAAYGFGEASQTADGAQVATGLMQQDAGWYKQILDQNNANPGQANYSKYASPPYDNGETGTQFPLLLSNDNFNNINMDYGARWERFGTPYADFLEYGGTGSQLQYASDGTPISSADSGMLLPYEYSWDPTQLGVYQMVPKAFSGNQQVRLAPWMICPSCPFTNDLFAGEQLYQWGYFIMTSYAYVGCASQRTLNSFTEFGGGGFPNGISVSSGFNGSIYPTWGNRVNKPAVTVRGNPADILCMDAVAWGGGSMQGNLYLINHPHYGNPNSPAFENVLHADGSVEGIDDPVFYTQDGQASNTLTNANWAEAHVPSPSPNGIGEVHFSSGDPRAWANDWNAIWTGWYFYWPNQPE
jgi:prepilin-type N-terminal cleavage/methylation domain-containing protein